MTQLDELKKLQKLIDKHSRFTDAIISNLTIKNIDGKFDNIELIIKSENENYAVKVRFEEVTESKIENIYKYIIWELQLKKENNYYIFHPIPVASEMGNLFIKSTKINFTDSSGNKWRVSPDGKAEPEK